MTKLAYNVHPEHFNVGFLKFYDFATPNIINEFIGTTDIEKY